LTVLGDFAAILPSFKDTASRVFANSMVQAQNYNLQATKVVLPNFNIETLYSSLHPAGINSAVVLNTTKGFLNGYYDDEGWWALAWIQAYDVTGSSEYLQTAASIFEDMENGSTTNCQGGIWWDKAQTYVNAIANELYLSVAAHLSNRMSNKQYYLDIALDQLAWFQHSGMINSENLVNDGLTATCTNNNGTEWSYNQGVLLGALVELSTASSNQTYLTTATSIAKAAIKFLSDSNGVLHDPCEPDCGADGSQFKGIFMRNLQILQQAAPDQSFLNFITSNADSIWAANRNSANELSLVWSGESDSRSNFSSILLFQEFWRHFHLFLQGLRVDG
jgi:predicted alpha-1,6-mannanase (GH76 family)